MHAFHTMRMKNRPNGLDNFELLVMVLSALMWRRNNGTISLMTDYAGLAYMKRLGMTQCWDGIDPCLDEMDSLGIDEQIFWAGAKIFALSRQKVPCVSIDLDFIVWKPLDFNCYGTDIAVIHREEIGNAVYPTAEFFLMKKGWRWPSFLDWGERACNMAFTYIGNQKLVELYWESARKFMQSAEGDGLPYMVFAEQRLISMWAKHTGTKIYSISSLEELYQSRQNCFTHLWGEKAKLRENPMERKKFCQRCADRIEREFPEIREIIKYVYKE